MLYLKHRKQRYCIFLHCYEKVIQDWIGKKQEYRFVKTFRIWNKKKTFEFFKSPYNLVFNTCGERGCLILSIILLGVVGYFTKKWYAESIKTKEEVRKQLLIEFENKGKGIYDVKSYEKLQYNTELVSKWIEKYPTDADKFLRFKEGYKTK